MTNSRGGVRGMVKEDAGVVYRVVFDRYSAEF